MIACLISKFNWMLPLLVLLAAKEIIMCIAGLIVIRKTDVVYSSQWFGKLTTVVLYAVMIVLFLFPEVPEPAANIMILTCAAMLLLSMVKYLMFYRNLLYGKEKQ